uniref:Uncharacterized protein n=1 Tax=Arundo donax TaxID=35708 RepID=A0A0A9FDA2_ARUDO
MRRRLGRRRRPLSRDSCLFFFLL